MTTTTTTTKNDDEMSAVHPQQAIPSLMRETTRPRACPDSRLLAKGVSYQHIFGTTTAIELESAPPRGREKTGG
jgi:hypothetical protein